MSANAYTRAIYLEEIFSVDFDQNFPGDWIELKSARDQLSHIYDITFVNLGFRVPSGSQEKEDDINFILNSDAFDKDGDEYTGQWVKINIKRKDDIINVWVARNPQAQRLRKLGSEARIRAISKSAEELGWIVEDSEKLRADAITNFVPPDPLQIPASDRVVSRTDNQDVVDQIDAALNEVSQLLRTDNEIGDELADGRNLISSELEVGKEITNGGAFRISSLLGWLSPALRFLAEKFASGAIGEAAKRLLQLLIDLL